MTYTPQPVPAHINSVDELRQWMEEELRRIAQHVADVEGPWTAYTPVLTPGSGAFTSAVASGRYKQIGKTVHLQIRVNITTLGTAAGGFTVSLPPIGVTKDNYVFPVHENNVVALMGWGRTGVNDTVVFVLRYDNGLYMGNAYQLFMNGTYELA